MLTRRRLLQLLGISIPVVKSASLLGMGAENGSKLVVPDEAETAALLSALEPKPATTIVRLHSCSLEELIMGNTAQRDVVAEKELGPMDWDVNNEDGIPYANNKTPIEFLNEGLPYEVQSLSVSSKHLPPELYFAMNMAPMSKWHVGTGDKLVFNPGNITVNYDENFAGCQFENKK